MNWYRPIRVAANGRLEVACKSDPRHLFWLSEREMSWPFCPHCAGWWHDIPDEAT